jgi:hypothetical protein
MPMNKRSITALAASIAMPIAQILMVVGSHKWWPSAGEQRGIHILIFWALATIITVGVGAYAASTLVIRFRIVLFVVYTIGILAALFYVDIRAICAFSECI